MNMNELLHAIVAKLPHASEATEQDFHAAVDAVAPDPNAAPAVPADGAAQDPKGK